MNWLPPVKHISAVLIAIGFSVNSFADEEVSPVVDMSNMTLTTNSLVELVINSNAQIIYADIQRRIAKEKISFEEGVYETELFSNLSYDDAHVQRSAGEKLSASLSAQNKQILDESNTDFTLGLRRIIGTGGEVTLSYLTQKKNNNIIPESTDPSVRESEFTSKLNLELIQPLLKGLGNAATETRIERAKIEDKVVDAQYRQQMLRVVFDSLSSYWQLYKVTRFISVREAALANAKSTLADIKRKAEIGKETQNSVFDAESEVLKRKIAFDSARQARNEAVYKLSTLININPDSLNGLQLHLNSKPDTSKFKLELPFDEYFSKVLVDWPDYQVLDLNIAMQEQEIELVRDELKPQLDLKMGYTLNHLDEEFNDSLDNNHPSWYVGVNFSMPIGGNERINAKKAIAMLKQDQQREDLNAVTVALKNDLKAKIFQVNNTYQEMLFLTENVQLLESLFNAEKKKFDLGYGELIDVYSREDSLNIERQRLIEGQIKYEIAKVSLALADGTLLKEYITLD